MGTGRALDGRRRGHRPTGRDAASRGPRSPRSPGRSPRSPARGGAAVLRAAAAGTRRAPGGRGGAVLGWGMRRGERLGVPRGRSIRPSPVPPFSGPQAEQLGVFSEWEGGRRPVPRPRRPQPGALTPPGGGLGPLASAPPGPPYARGGSIGTDPVLSPAVRVEAPAFPARLGSADHSRPSPPNTSARRVGVGAPRRPRPSASSQVPRDRGRAAPRRAGQAGGAGEG